MRAAPVRLAEQRKIATVRPRIEIVAAAGEIGLDRYVTRDLASEHRRAEREPDAAHRVARGGARDARASGGHDQLLARERQALDADEAKRGKGVELDGRPRLVAGQRAFGRHETGLDDEPGGCVLRQRLARRAEPDAPRLDAVDFRPTVVRRLR